MQFDEWLARHNPGAANWPIAKREQLRAKAVAMGLVDSPESDQPLPPLIIRGLNFASAMARWTLAGFPRRAPEEIAARLAVCESCPHFAKNHCTHCGCACVETDQILNKLALATETCPDGRWP